MYLAIFVVYLAKPLNICETQILQIKSF